MDTPQHNPKKRKDQRPTLTFKGDEFGPEFRALINKAAERAGMSQSQFVAETLRREAQRIIKGNPPDTPSDTPPLPAIPTERLDAQDRRIADLAEQIRRFVEIQTERQRATLWTRIRAAFGSSSKAAEVPPGVASAA